MAGAVIVFPFANTSNREIKTLPNIANIINKNKNIANLEKHKTLMMMMMAKMAMVLKMTIMAVISKMLLMAHWANQVVATSPHKTEFTDSATTGLCQKKRKRIPENEEF